MSFSEEEMYEQYVAKPLMTVLDDVEEVYDRWVVERGDASDDFEGRVATPEEFHKFYSQMLYYWEAIDSYYAYLNEEDKTDADGVRIEHFSLLDCIHRYLLSEYPHYYKCSTDELLKMYSIFRKKYGRIDYLNFIEVYKDFEPIWNENNSHDQLNWMDPDEDFFEQLYDHFMGFWEEGIYDQDSIYDFE